MLTIEKCKKYLKNRVLSDKEIEEIRDYLYLIARQTIKEHIEAHKVNILKTR